jgi:hypothetical protein
LLNAVVGLNTLADVVSHLGHHGLLVGDGESGNDEQYAADACQNDQLA